MNISYRSNTESKILGLDWVRRFLVRYPKMSIGKPEVTYVAGVVEFNKMNVDKFFEINSNILTDHKNTSNLGQTLCCFRFITLYMCKITSANFVKTKIWQNKQEYNHKAKLILKAYRPYLNQR